MTTDRVERRLAAILSADVVGYSRLMGADEEGTLARLKALRREFFNPKISEHRGRMVKLMGDGALVEFASGVDAVRCAVEMLQEVAQCNAGAPEDQRIEFRIGVNLGDVIIEEDDIYGDGVNVAARLQEICEPGGVCISGGLYDQVRNKLDVSFEDLGERSVKNIADPVHVYAVGPTKGSAMGLDRGGELPLPSKPSVAVLPFANMSGDPEQEHIADAVTEEITTELSRYRDLFVIASHSAFAFKDRRGDVRQIARELGVRYILEGSVRQAGGRVRIGPQLIDAVTGGHVWADRFDGNIEDIFALQDQVATKTAGAVGGGILSAEIESVARQRPENLNAYGLYAKGMGFLVAPTRQGLANAKDVFSRAIDLDPGYSNAHVGIGWSYFLEFIFGWSEEPTHSLVMAHQTSRRAVELDTYNDRAHAISGVCLVSRKEFELARTEADRSLELNPNLAAGYLSRSFVNVFSERHEDGVADALKAIRLSPRDPLMFGFENFVAWGSYLARDYETAAEWASRMVAKYPGFIFGHTDLALACAQLGQYERANNALKEALRITPDLVETLKHQPLKDPADMEHMWDGLRKAGLEI
jgi:adenylate cyclase